VCVDECARLLVKESRVTLKDLFGQPREEDERAHRQRETCQ
jgi:hypothetical protein